MARMKAAPRRIIRLRFSSSMNWREKQDDPVWFEFVGRRLCADEECGHRTDHYFNLEAGNVLSQKYVVTGDEHYATGLNVCTSGSGKIKGVRWFVNHQVFAEVREVAADLVAPAGHEARPEQ